MRRSEKWHGAEIALTNKMFEIAGHAVTHADVAQRQDAWYRDWTMTVEEAEQWQAWGTEYLMRHLSLSRDAAVRQMRWCNLQWGLKYSNYPDHEDK